MTRLWGSSDDLIEVDGDIEDEFDLYLGDNRGEFSASDGTRGYIIYDGDGNWKFNILGAGSQFIKKVISVGETARHIDDAQGCASYSDVIIFGDIEWIKVTGDGKTYKAKRPKQ